MGDFDERHGAMGVKPPIVAVMLYESVHYLSLPTLATRRALQADETQNWSVNIEYSGIARPSVEVRACGPHSGPDLACEHLLEKPEMAFFAIAKLGGGGLGGGDRSLHGWKVAPHRRHLRGAKVSKREARVRFGRTREFRAGLRAGHEKQAIAGIISVTGGRRRRCQRVVVIVSNHGILPSVSFCGRSEIIAAFWKKDADTLHEAQRNLVL